MKGFLATFSTREYINIDNIQKIDTYCYNNYNLTSILSFRKCKVNEDIVLDCGVDGFYIECSPELRKLFLDTKMSLKEFLNILKLATTLNDYELFICCLYYFNNPRRIVDLEDGLKYFLQECNSNSDYIDIYKDIYGTYIESIPLYPFYINFKDFIENNYLAINFNNTEYIFEK